MTRVMATETKRAMATNSYTGGNGYHCPSSSAAAAVAAVEKNHKGGGCLFLYGVVAKNWFVHFLKFDVLQGGLLSRWPFVPAIFRELCFYGYCGRSINLHVPYFFGGNNKNLSLEKEKLANHVPPRLVYFHMPLSKIVVSAYSHQNYAVQICHYFS